MTRNTKLSLRRRVVTYSVALAAAAGISLGVGALPTILTPASADTTLTAAKERIGQRVEDARKRAEAARKRAEEVRAEIARSTPSIPPTAAPEAAPAPEPEAPAAAAPEAESTEESAPAAESAKPEAAPAPAPATGERVVTGRITGYSWFDNDPPGSAAIAYDVRGRGQASGTGTFEDPITAAVPSGTYAPGTVLYLPHQSRYVIVEDLCGACGSGDVDVWVDGRSVGEAEVDRCMARLTGQYEVVVDAAPGRPVQAGPVCGG